VNVEKLAAHRFLFVVVHYQVINHNSQEEQILQVLNFNRFCRLNKEYRFFDRLQNIHSWNTQM